MDYIKEFTAKIQDLDRSKSIQSIFQDFLSLSTYSLAQPFYRSSDIEQKYKLVIDKYTKEQADEFPKLLAFLINALEEEHQDFLGQIYMNLGFGNAKKGQFFTPYSVSKMMSEINFADIDLKMKNKDFITLSEPCCGSGGIIIAFAETVPVEKIIQELYVVLLNSVLFAFFNDIDILPVNARDSGRIFRTFHSSFDLK